jgi:hypothetical protein
MSMSMSKYVTPVLLAAGVVLAANPVQAQRPGRQGKGPPPRPSFEDMDANGDQQVTFDEFVEAQKPMLQRRFDRLDQNGDGTVTADEMTKASDFARERMRKMKMEREGQPEDEPEE